MRIWKKIPKERSHVKSSSQSHPTGKVKKTDNTIEAVAIKCQGSIVLVDFPKVSGNIGAQDERPLGTCVNMGERGAEVSVMLLKLQHSVPDGRHCK